MSSSKTVIVHLCTRADWEVAQRAGAYRAASLESEGFIHCSRPDQIFKVVNTFYQQIPDLVLLWLEPEKIAAEIRWEAADGDEFPHIYGPLNLDAVIRVSDFLPDADGVYRTLPE
ncbi:MAG: DUF952 domain-containing protein [Chloroflexi bacterium]|jgi:uncharacterized protein (DUF952 family)|nr:DUF952 domain-containing protein [Chloroflexota bacterium]